jgi:hypothetical protein
MEKNKAQKTEHVLIHTEKSVIKIIFGEFDKEVDVDKLTSIDYSNIYAEAITSAALLNKVGLLKAQAQEECEHKKLELAIYDAERRKEKRREAVDNSGKFKVGEEWVKLTVDSLNEAMVLDEGYQIKKKNVITAEKNFNFVDAIYWAVQSKDKKLNVMIQGVTPEELANEIVEGKINTLYISKHKKTLTNN